jgi:ribonuclease HI
LALFSCISHNCSFVTVSEGYYEDREATGRIGK